MYSQIKFDYSAIEIVVDYFSNPDINKISGIVSHPAYKLVYKHSKLFSSNPINENILILSINGKSNFFNFLNINDKLSKLRETVNYLRNNEQKMREEFSSLSLLYLPKDYKPNATVYFIIGGYNGIALNDQVAINIYWEQFLKDPQEILLYLPHELFHIGFAHYQQLPDISAVKTKEDLKNVVMRITIDEGLATLVPYKKRIALNALQDYDYSILTDNSLLSKKVDQFENLMQLFNKENNNPVDDKLIGEVLGECSGDRLFYIVGCYMGLTIEKKYGRGKLIELIKHNPKDFFEVFNSTQK